MRRRRLSERCVPAFPPLQGDADLSRANAGKDAGHLVQDAWAVRGLQGGPRIDAACQWRRTRTEKEGCSRARFVPSRPPPTASADPSPAPIRASLASLLRVVARPKTLFDKAKSNAKTIKAIYAPKKRFSGVAVRASPSTATDSTAQSTVKPSVPPETKTKTLASPTKRPADRTDSPPAKRKRPVITTVTRTVSRPASTVSTAASSRTTPAASPPPPPYFSSNRLSQGARTPSFSPPPPLSSLAAASHPRSLASPPQRTRTDPPGAAMPAKAVSPPQQSPAARPRARPPSASIFMPKKR